MGVAKYALLAFTHPTELRSLVTWWMWHDNSRDIENPKEHVTSGWDRESMRECWRLLDLTSRSFSMVIKELDGDLARVVCLFYLVLRSLDTVEDDMTLPNSVKLPLLKDFYNKLDEPGWNFTQSGPNEKDREALVKFDVVIEEINRLEPKYKDVIQDICRKMGRGMASFAALSTPEQPVAEVDTIADYDLYCHFVAGLVGEGLSGLFSASGKERNFIKDQLTLSNHMGLLLQKTNILRDFREDVDEGRGFWPKAIWGKYGFATMGDLRDPAREREAMWALSEMTLDALRHATPALDYLTLLKCQSVFNFVAIPAVMAIATLERCYGNPQVLKTNVKIRKGEAVGLMALAINPRDVGMIFVKYAKLIHKKTKIEDPNFIRISIACGKIEQWMEHHYPSFVEVSGGQGGAKTTVNMGSGDARARVYQSIVAAEDIKEGYRRAEAAAIKRKELVQSLRDRGLLKTPATEPGALTDKEHTEQLVQQTRLAEGGGIPWDLIGVIVGAIAGIAGLSALIVWFCLTYLDSF